MKSLIKILQSLPFILCLVFFSCQKDPAGLQNYNTDNWELSTPEAQGMNSQILSGAFDEAENLGYVDCILIIRNSYIVAEKYFNGYDVNSAHNVKSVSKSFLSALTGIALREGYIDNLDQKMLSFFPEYRQYAQDERKLDITIRHLLMMRAGIEHERNNYSQLYNSPNWIKATIEFPLTYDPGNTFSYNTFQTHLLSAILTKSSGMSTLEFAEKDLFEPLNISVDRWDQGPQGYYFGGNNMYFRPRDMAMLGYLYLNNGKLYGRKVIPSAWVQESLTNYTGFSGNDWGELKNVNYGYLWWLGEMNNYEAFLAVGYGGQFVITFPDLNMIVVTTADNHVSWDTSDQHIGEILSVVARYILPAIG